MTNFPGADPKSVDSELIPTVDLARMIKYDFTLRPADQSCDSSWYDSNATRIPIRSAKPEDTVTVGKVHGNDCHITVPGDPAHGTIGDLHAFVYMWPGQVSIECSNRNGLIATETYQGVSGRSKTVRSGDELVHVFSGPDDELKLLMPALNPLVSVGIRPAP